MTIRRSLPNIRLTSMFCVCFLAQCAFQEIHAEINYRIEHVDTGDYFTITGGSVTTDGTLGLLAPSNIIAMSVDISSRTFILSPTGLEILDGSTTLDLMNAEISMEGLVEASSTGIRIVQATEAGERNTLGLVRQVGGASVSWASAHYDFPLGGNRHTGFSNSTIVVAPPAYAMVAGLPNSGLIARVIPEPSAICLVLIGLGVSCARFRR
jgi:hypothetical protein